jgi:hypothetical protein
MIYAGQESDIAEFRVSSVRVLIDQLNVIFQNDKDNFLTFYQDEKALLIKAFEAAKDAGQPYGLLGPTNAEREEVDWNSQPRNGYEED